MEKRTFLIKLKIRDENGEIHQLEKKEQFEYEIGKNSNQKTITFEGKDKKEYKFDLVLCSVRKGWFGDRPNAHNMDTSPYLSKQGKLEFIEREIKDTGWRTEGKVLLIGGLIALFVGLTVALLILSRRKRQQ